MSRGSVASRRRVPLISPQMSRPTCRMRYSLVIAGWGNRWTRWRMVADRARVEWERLLARAADPYQPPRIADAREQLALLDTLEHQVATAHGAITEGVHLQRAYRAGTITQLG